MVEGGNDHVQGLLLVGGALWEGRGEVEDGVRSERLWRRSGRRESAYGAAGGCRSDPSVRGERSVAGARKQSSGATQQRRGSVPRRRRANSGDDQQRDGGTLLRGRGDLGWRDDMVARDGRGGPGE